MDENFPVENLQPNTDKIIVIDEACDIDKYELRTMADAMDIRSGDLVDFTLQEGFERMTAHPIDTTAMSITRLASLASMVTTHKMSSAAATAEAEEYEHELRITRLSELDEGIKETVRSARNYAISRSFTKDETLRFIDKCIQLHQEVNCRLSVRDYYLAGVKLGLIAQMVKPKPDTRSKPSKMEEPIVHSSKADRKRLPKLLKSKRKK